MDKAFELCLHPFIKDFPYELYYDNIRIATFDTDNILKRFGTDEGLRWLEERIRLIAAAPDLYDALKAVLKIADRQTVEFNMARAAIAKAEGG